MAALGKECVCETFDELAILIKPETVYSDDSLPVAANAVLFTGAPTISIQGEKLSRDLAKPYYGNDAEELVGKFIQIEGEIEITSSGAAGDAPAIAALLKSCGFGETITPGTEVVYDPASENIPSNTVYFQRAKDLWKVVGCRADFSLTMQAKQYGKYRFTICGLFALPEDSATLPSVDVSTFQKPLVLDYQNTPTANFFATAVDVDSFEFSLGNTLEKKDKPGCYAVSISDRNPTASITMCAPRISTLDIRGLADSNTTGEVEIVHGVDAGEIFGIRLTRADIDLVGVQDVQIGTNEKGITVPLLPLPITGDDEVQLTYK